MSVTVDVSELRTLATDLGRIPDKVQRGVKPIVAKGAFEVKRKMQADMRESNYFKGNARNISYDLKVSGDGVEAEIGPSPTQLAHIAYFGGANGGGNTVDLLGPLGEEVGPFEENLSKLLDGVL